MIGSKIGEKLTTGRKRKSTDFENISSKRKKTESTGFFGLSAIPYKGMSNRDQTSCWFNASIQALSETKFIVKLLFNTELLYSIPFEPIIDIWKFMLCNRSPSVPDEVLRKAKLFVSQGQYNYEYPISDTDSISGSAKMGFQSNMQQDASEMFNIITDHMMDILYHRTGETTMVSN